MNLSLRELVLVILGQSGEGRFKGRTLLQKRGYFLSVLTGRELGFKPHYYGPYSPSVNAAREELCALGLVEEHVLESGATGSRGFEIKRYDYEITADGRRVLDWLADRKKDDYQKASQYLEKMTDAGEPDYMTLSLAAKAYFIVNTKNGSVTTDQIRQEARNFDWEMDERGLNEGVVYLEKLHLVKRNKA
jgi:uncharacterized protein YwgA